MSVTIGEAQLGYVPFDPRLEYTVPLPHGVRTEAREALAHRIGDLRPTLFAYQWVPAAEPA